MKIFEIPVFSPIFDRSFLVLIMANEQADISVRSFSVSGGGRWVTGLKLFKQFSTNDVPIDKQNRLMLDIVK